MFDENNYLVENSISSKPLERIAEEAEAPGANMDPAVLKSATENIVNNALNTQTTQQDFIISDDISKSFRELINGRKDTVNVPNDAEMKTELSRFFQQLPSLMKHTSRIISHRTFT